MDLGSLANIALAALGISFLIFFHELGHFLAARLFGVRVEVFSIGFGPTLLSARRGETDYRLSLIPLGGYVKMAGEYGDLSDETPSDPSDLTAKPAWQRGIVFSGGVLMNVLLAFLLLPVAFTIGVPFTAPVVGSVEPGGAAWAADVRPGDEILAVNGRRVYGFEDVGMEVTLGDLETTRLRLRRDGQELELALQPVRSEEKGLYDIGVGPADNGLLTVSEDGPAAGAGLRLGDRPLSVSGRRIGSDLSLGQALSRAGMEAGRPLLLEVERDGTALSIVVEPRRQTDERYRRLGAYPTSTLVRALRGPAAAPGFPLRNGDRVRSVEGRPVLEAGALRDALGPQVAPGPLQLELVREGETRNVTLDDADRAVLSAGHVAFGTDLVGRTLRIIPDGALHRAGLRDGDEIVELDGRSVAGYADFRDRVHAAEKDVLAVTYRRGTQAPTTVRARTLPVTSWDYGIGIQGLEVLHRETLPGAVRAGAECSVNALRTTWLTLHRLITGDVSARNVGGIVTISVLTYHFASWGLAKLLFLLAVLSINLAFVNILPIPVLDGGQLMLLGFEKIKGSRLSEAFLQRMQLAGLVAVLALVLYVTYNDILRLVG